MEIQVKKQNNLNGPEWYFRAIAETNLAEKMTMSAKRVPYNRSNSRLEQEFVLSQGFSVRIRCRSQWRHGTCACVSFQTIYSVTMSWLTRILPKIASKPADAENKKKSPIPAGLWTKCPKCDQVLYKEELDDSLQVCPKCGHHLRLSGRKRLDAFLDWKGVHEEIGADVRPVDTLGFVDSKSYPTRLEASQGATKETDALVVMRGELRRRPVVAAAFDFAFMGGSMGSVVGERFALGVERALRENIPFVTFTSTGGARMQEGLLSLMQMAKTNAAVTLLEKARIPYVSVLTDPTMGGVSASFAFMGDVVIAEPQALIGFAGPRVIEQTVREKLPAGFQRSQMLLEKGAIDMIVDRRDMRQVVSELIALLSNKPTPSV